MAFLGRTMFTRYTYAFELSALLLTVATIGAVILARRKDLAPEDEDEEPVHLDPVAAVPAADGAPAADATVGVADTGDAHDARDADAAPGSDDEREA